MLQESGVIPRIMRKWRDSRDNNYDMEEALSLGFENLLFPINLLARIHHFISRKCPTCNPVRIPVSAQVYYNT